MDAGYRSAAHSQRRLIPGFIGSAVDISDQKLAQEALQNIGGELIEAQEEERVRIARNSMTTSAKGSRSSQWNWNRRFRVPMAGMVPRIQKLKRFGNIVPKSLEMFRRCRHKLHSSKLEYLGVVAAIRSFCREFCQQPDAVIQFSEEGVQAFCPGYVPFLISSCTGSPAKCPETSWRKPVPRESARHSR